MPRTVETPRPSRCEHQPACDKSGCANARPAYRGTGGCEQLPTLLRGTHEHPWMGIGLVLRSAVPADSRSSARTGSGRLTTAPLSSIATTPRPPSDSLPIPGGPGVPSQRWPATALGRMRSSAGRRPALSRAIAMATIDRSDRAGWPGVSDRRRESRDWRIRRPLRVRLRDPRTRRPRRDAPLRDHAG